MRQIRGSRLAKVMLVPRSGSRRLALLRTRAAALRAPAAAAAETMGIHCVSLIPAEVRKPLRSARILKKSVDTRNASRFPSKEAGASSGYHQKKCWLKSAKYRDSLDISTFLKHLARVLHSVGQTWGGGGSGGPELTIHPSPFFTK